MWDFGVMLMLSVDNDILDGFCALSPVLAFDYTPGQVVLL
jgi:hypothetical protein